LSPGEALPSEQMAKTSAIQKHGGASTAL